MYYIHFILFNLYLGCWLGIYYLIFSRKITFKINRFLLLGGIIIAGILPFLSFSFLHSPAPTTSSAVSIGMGTAAVIPESVEQTVPSFPLWYVLVGIYWMGVLITGTLFMIRWIRIHRCAKRYPQQKQHSYIHVILPQNHETFSFGKYLFAPKNISESILEHEKVHISQKHSLDNIFLETVKVLCWFNPAVYKYQKALKMVHEYLADHLATNRIQLSDYAEKMVSQSISISKTALVHPFLHSSNLQKRLMMLKKNRQSPKRRWIYFLLIPFLIGMIFLTSSFSVKEKLNHSIAKIKPTENNLLSVFSSIQNKQSIKGYVHTPSGEPLSEVTLLLPDSRMGTSTDKKGYFELNAQPGNSLQLSRIGFNTLTVTIPKNKNTLQFILYPKPNTLNRLQVTGYVNTPVAPSPATSKSSSHIDQKSNTAVFQPVAQMPHFPGGQEKMMQYLLKHIKYPTKAKKHGIQGNIVVQFTVNQEGGLENIKTVGEKLGYGLEQEAARLVQNMPKWIPGKQNGKNIKVQYHLPIRFSLNGPKTGDTNKDSVPSSKTFQFVEDMPQFPGGQSALIKYLSQHIHYPQKAKEDSLQGTIVGQFVVEKDGSISDVKTVGQRKGDSLEEEVIRVIKAMPKWVPGKQNGKIVRVQYSLPVRFTFPKQTLNTDSIPPVSSTSATKNRPAPPAPPAPPNPNAKATFDSSKPYTFVEDMPQFPGGKDSLMKYLSAHIKYPKKAREHVIQGTVVVQFIVNKDGTISEAKARGKKLGYGLEQEAVRVVKGMPKWIPGKQDGKRVAVKYSLPLRFTLQ